MGLIHVDVLLLNDAIAYLVLSNLVLLVVSLVLCTSLAETLGRLTQRQFPRLWWVAAPIGYSGLLVVTLSFLLWMRGDVMKRGSCLFYSPW